MRRNKKYTRQANKKIAKWAGIESPIDYSGKPTEGFSMLPCDECRNKRHGKCEYFKECTDTVNKNQILIRFQWRTDDGK